MDQLYLCRVNHGIDRLPLPAMRELRLWRIRANGQRAGRRICRAPTTHDHPTRHSAQHSAAQPADTANRPTWRILKTYLLNTRLLIHEHRAYPSSVCLSLIAVWWFAPFKILLGRARRVLNLIHVTRVRHNYRLTGCIFRRWIDDRKFTTGECQ